MMRSRATARWVPIFLDEAEELILHDDGRGFGVLDDVGGFACREAEVHWHGDQPRLGGGGVDLGPFEAIVGENGDAVAFA